MIDIKDILSSEPKDSRRCLLIAEVAQAHDGSLGTAHAYIDAVANAGADAVKFQTHIAEAESTPAEPWRVRFSRQDATRYDYWRRMEFTEDQWRGLREHAAERKLLFLSSPFSERAVGLLSRVGVDAWKVASGEVSSSSMFAMMASTGKPFLVSTGMSGFAEIDGVAQKLKGCGLPFALMQCTTAYPCPAEKVGLNVMSQFRDRYLCPVGLSDHSGTVFPGLAAASLGASVVEVHVTLSREAFGPDVVASVTTSELELLAEGIRFIERIHANPVDKDAAATSLVSLRRMFGKSLVAGRKLEIGQRLALEDVSLKKPGFGMPEERLPQLIGRKLIRGVEQDEPILEEYFE